VAERLAIDDLIIVNDQHDSARAVAALDGAFDGRVDALEALLAQRRRREKRRQKQSTDDREVTVH
jgi:hypothetical protein